MARGPRGSKVSQWRERQSQPPARAFSAPQSSRVPWLSYMTCPTAPGGVHVTYLTAVRAECGEAAGRVRRVEVHHRRAARHRQGVGQPGALHSDQQTRAGEALQLPSNHG